MLSPFIIVAAQKDKAQKISPQDVGKPNGQGNRKLGVCNWPVFDAEASSSQKGARTVTGVEKGFARRQLKRK